MKTLQNYEILSELNAEFPSAMIYTLDLSYHVIARASVTRFGVELHAIQRLLGVEEWDEAYDCEDQALLAWTIGKLKHLNAKRKIGAAVNQGVAMGILCYRIAGQPGRGHAVNIFRTQNGWEAYEPQRQVVLQLSQLERETAWLILI